MDEIALPEIVVMSAKQIHNPFSDDSVSCFISKKE